MARVTKTDLAELKRFLKANCRGKNNRMTANRINSMLGWSAAHSEWDCPYVRKAVGLLRDEGMFICGGPRGFYIPETIEEIAEGKRNYAKRIWSAIQRWRHIDPQGTEKMLEFAGQLGLFDTLTDKDKGGAK